MYIEKGDIFIMDYDFSEMLECVLDIRDSYDSEDYNPRMYGCNSDVMNEALRRLKDQLNKFFSDKHCDSVIFTKNTDNKFFGIVVKPTKYNINMFLKSDMENGDSFYSYIVEFDSKLFDPITEYTANNILAGLIHDVSEVVDSKTVYEVKCAIDAICCGLDQVPDIILSERLREVFRFAVEEAIYRMRSMYNYSYGDLVLPNEVVKSYGLTDGFNGEFERIQSLRSDLDTVNRYDTLVLNWFFYWAGKSTIYDTLPIYTLRKYIDCTGSLLLKSSAYSAIQSLGTVTSHNTYIEESKKKSLVANIKLNGMKSIEDDLYEYAMRVKNIDDEASAIQLMRQINSRMGIISDYLSEEDLSEHERKRWDKLYEKYDKIREEMIKKPIYSRKMYGLFVDYNALMNMSAANYSTLNSMY